MIIYIPFVFFTILFIRHFKKMGKKLDMAGIILLVYGVSAMFSIIMYATGLTIDADDKYRPSLGATIFYCGILFICIYPFMKYSNIKFTSIRPSNNELFLRVLSWLALFWFLMTVFIDYNAIIQVLNGDIIAMRAAIYEGEGRLVQSEASKIPFLVRAPWTLFNYIFKCPWVMIFFAFYSKSVQKMPWLYFIFFLLASTNVIMDSILGLDRSKVAYWILGMGANYMLFRGYMSTGNKKTIKAIMVLFFTIAVAYLTLMTESRFGDRSYGNSEVGGSLGGVISYLGMSYPNFCFFFDNHICKWTTLAVIFPTSYFFFAPDEPSGLVVVQRYMDEYLNYSTGVFYTFIGSIMALAGKLVAIIYCACYSLFSHLILSRITQKTTTVVTIFIYYALSSVLLLGVFVYYYGDPIIDMSVIISFFIIKFFLSSEKK